MKILIIASRVSVANTHKVSKYIETQNHPLSSCPLDSFTCILILPFMNIHAYILNKQLLVTSTFVGSDTVKPVLSKRPRDNPKSLA